MKGLLIIAACNEELSLNKFLPKLNRSLSSLPRIQFKTLLIDDGSKDRTAQVAEANGCSVIRNEENRGLGTSLRIGYSEALKRTVDVAVTMDADGQHDPSLLPEFLAGLEGGADLVIGSRYHPESKRLNVPFDRDLLNISARTHLEIVTGWKLTDPLAGFWAMNHRVIEFVARETTFPRYGTCLELLVKFWFLMQPRPRIVEVPHPAIYGNGDLAHALFTRDYSPGRLRDRTQRFTDHAEHIIDAFSLVKEKIGAEIVEREVNARREEWCRSERQWQARSLVTAP